MQMPEACSKIVTAQPCFPFRKRSPFSGMELRLEASMDSVGSAALTVLTALFFGLYALLSGQSISCYYPFLLSRRFFFRVKHPRRQRLLISEQKNRSSGTRTRLENWDKMSLLGIIYYPLQAFLLTAAYFCLASTAVLTLTARESLLVLHLNLMAGSAVLSLTGFLFSWADYDLWKLFHR